MILYHGPNGFEIARPPAEVFDDASAPFGIWITNEDGSPGGAFLDLIDGGPQYRSYGSRDAAEDRAVLWREGHPAMRWEVFSLASYEQWTRCRTGS